MRHAHSLQLPCLVLSSYLLVASFAGQASAQDTTDLPPPAPPSEPGAPASPAEAPSAPPAAAAAPSAPPGATAPAVGAFAPLPAEAPPKPAPRAAKVGPAAKEPAPQPARAPSAPAAEEPSAPANVNHADYEPKKDDNESDGLFGPFRIGVLVGGGLPELLSLGGQIKLTRFFGAGINVGLIPTVKIAYYGEAKLSYQEYDAYGRLYPFGGAFFLGAGVGYATIRGSLANRFNTASYTQSHPEILVAYPTFPNAVAVDSDARVRTLVLTPQIGFMKIFGSGFTIGLDVGAQIPIAPSQVNFDTTTPSLGEPLNSIVQSTYIAPNDQKVRSSLNNIGRTPLPTFNLKIGWFL